MFYGEKRNDKIWETFQKESFFPLITKLSPPFNMSSGSVRGKGWNIQVRSVLKSFGFLQYRQIDLQYRFGIVRVLQWAKPKFKQAYRSHFSFLFAVSIYFVLSNFLVDLGLIFTHFFRFALVQESTDFVSYSFNFFITRKLLSGMFILFAKSSEITTKITQMLPSHSTFSLGLVWIEEDRRGTKGIKSYVIKLGCEE